MKPSIVLVLIIASVALAFPGEKDEVIILPGLRIQPTFKHYSGYLNGSKTRLLHYWFLESENQPAKDPLVLWLNGGPGCSSLMGLLTEHGPFRITDGGYLRMNPHSWNKMANIIYLESPACVGFSYSTDGKCDATDDSTSLINYNSLVHFFLKFPQYKNRDFYITGESYGGYYVPTLAVRIVQSKTTPYIQLKGIAIGNAYSSVSENHNGNLHFAYNHGLVSDRLWSSIIETCCRNIDPIHCNLSATSNRQCLSKITMAINQYSGINPYNIYSKCLTSSNTDKLSIWNILNVASNYDRVRIMMGWIDNDDKTLVKLRKEYIILKAYQQKFGPMHQTSPIPCISDSLSATYLNRKRVKLALHIPSNLLPWSVCSNWLQYKRNYYDMDSQYKTLFKLRNFRIWLYNGDVDMMCSYLSEEWYFERFNMSVKQSRKPWVYKDQANVSIVGGFVKIWDKFVLATVRGAGHMVPTDKPIAAFHLFRSFLDGKDL